MKKETTVYLPKKIVVDGLTYTRLKMSLVSKTYIYQIETRGEWGVIFIIGYTVFKAFELAKIKRNKTLIIHRGSSDNYRISANKAAALKEYVKLTKKYDPNND